MSKEKNEYVDKVKTILTFMGLSAIAYSFSFFGGFTAKQKAKATP